MAKTKGRATVEKKARRLEKLKIKWLGTDELKPNIYNPNRQSDREFELLRRSMSEDGFTQPIVALPDHTIVDGEHRWRMARDLGYEKVPVVIVDMTPEQARIATLRHNRARGTEDIELTSAVMRDLRELGALDWAQDSLMMDDVELQKMLEDVSAPEALAGEDFSQGWEPETGENALALESEAMRSQAASDAKREAEKRIAEAKTAEERAQAQRDKAAGSCTLTFVVSREEGKVVREALGNRPAARLVELCRASLTSQ